MTDRAESRRIRSLRPPRPRVDAWQPLDVLVEAERHADGQVLQTATVFLAGSECPFTCVFCDLWRSTLEEPTPRGSIPEQLRIAVGRLDGEPCAAIKLYNASNFFDPRAVPVSDLADIAAQVSLFARTIVECHPKLVGESCRRFARSLRGRLEVAIGLETAHPETLDRLNKQMSLGDFERAVADLAAFGISTRAFVLVDPPFTPRDEALEWTVRSVEFALASGVEVVSLIPTRPSPGEMARLQAAGLFRPPSLRRLERAVEGSMALGRGVVQADLWDVERLEACPQCRGDRVERLRRMNLSGALEAPIACGSCIEREEATCPTSHTMSP